jgi:hypothetical protein
METFIRQNINEWFPKILGSVKPMYNIQPSLKYWVSASAYPKISLAEMIFDPFVISLYKPTHIIIASLTNYLIRCVRKLITEKS